MEYNVCACTLYKYTIALHESVRTNFYRYIVYFIAKNASLHISWFVMYVINWASRCCSSFLMILCLEMLLLLMLLIFKLEWQFEFFKEGGSILQFPIEQTKLAESSQQRMKQFYTILWFFAWYSFSNFTLSFT